MNISRKHLLTIALSIATATATPGFASVIINAPANGSTVSSPFPLSAYTSLCSGQQVAAIGYSLDNSSDTTIVKAPAITTAVSAPAGGHTLHVKAWGVSGSVCVTDVALIVSLPSVFPSYAKSITGLQAMPGWFSIHDTGTPGSSNGWTGITNPPSRSGAALKYSMNYSGYGGERFSIAFGDDTSASNFVFDTWVYIPSPNSGLVNLELDLNQVLAGGQTVLYGMQCDGWTNSWDITVNKGTTQSPNMQWQQTNVPCNVRSWSTNTWHHVQLAYSRNDTGWITYKSVTLDGVSHSINTTVLGACNLGWAPVLLVNVQLDGSTSTSGSANILLDDMAIYRW